MLMFYNESALHKDYVIKSNKLGNINVIRMLSECYQNVIRM